MTALQIGILLLVAAAGTLTVLTREPTRQLIALCLFGLLLSVMFAVFQAPDVALSQLAVGTVAMPLMVLLTLVELRRDDEADRRNDGKENDGKENDGKENDGKENDGKENDGKENDGKENEQGDEGQEP
jgi:energy-converting hydrogenase B subunit D